MSLTKEIAKKVLPKKTINHIRKIRTNRLKSKIEAYPPLTEKTFTKILTGKLKIKKGDVVFIHSSLDLLQPDFPFYKIIPIIKRIIGEDGTFLMPTYPKLSSYEFLKSGQVFDVRKTPSYTGMLTELARRNPNAIRSLHPTKSVCAVGPLAEGLTSTHHLSPYPYDSCSPYYKIMGYDGIVIGIGVSTAKLSFVHCVDDAMKNKFSVKVYYKKCFSAKCINYNGETQIVKTYAHNMYRINVDNIPKFMAKYIPNNICQDISIQGRSFFRLKAKESFKQMLTLAKSGKTIYPLRCYKLKEILHQLV